MVFGRRTQLAALLLKGLVMAQRLSNRLHVLLDLHVDTERALQSSTVTYIMQVPGPHLPLISCCEMRYLHGDEWPRFMVEQRHNVLRAPLPI